MFTHAVVWVDSAVERFCLMDRARGGAWFLSFQKGAQKKLTHPEEEIHELIQSETLRRDGDGLSLTDRGIKGYALHATPRR